MGRMDPKIEEAIYRITQEALTNVGKHSQAKRVRVELARHDGQVHLEVRDWVVGLRDSTISTETFDEGDVRTCQDCPVTVPN